MNNIALIDETKKYGMALSKVFLSALMYLMLFCQIYSYKDMPYIRISNRDFAFQQRAVSDKTTVAVTIIVLFCILVFYFSNKKLVNGAYLITGLIVLIGACQWVFITIVDVGVESVLYGSTAPYVYITALMYCVGLDEDLFKVFLVHAKIIGVVSLLLCLVSSIEFFGTHKDTILADCSNLRYYIQAFWLLCICSFNEEKTNKWFYYLIMVSLAVMSLFFSSRSWLIQTALWMLLYTFFSNKKLRLVVFLRKLILVLLIVTIVAFLITSAFPDFLEAFTDKKSPVETRSGQYKDLFNQTTFFDFIVGRGYNFSYYSSIQGGDYNYIDNAYLMMLIKYGLIIGASYTLMFVIPLVKMRFSKCSAPLLLWLFALGGLSIFNATIVDLKSVAIAILAGRCMYLSKKD